MEPTVPPEEPTPPDREPSPPSEGTGLDLDGSAAPEIPLPPLPEPPAPTTAAQYLASWGFLTLAGVGVYLAASFGRALHDWRWAALAAAGSAGVGLGLGAWSGRRLARGWASVGVRLVGACAIGLVTFVTALSLPGMLALTFLVGAAAGPEIVRIVKAHLERRVRGEPHLFPAGLPLGSLIAALGGAVLVIGATRHLTPVRAGFLAGLLANLWALAAVPVVVKPGWGARLAMVVAAGPALALVAVVGGKAAWILAVLAVPALAARVRLAGTAPAAAALILGVMLLRPEMAISKEAIGDGFMVLRASNVRLTADAQDEAIAAMHRETGGLRVQAAGMTFFTDIDDVRRAEILVHPVLALAPRRARVLLMGSDCTGLARVLARYPDLAVVDVLRLNPGVESFCRGVPAIAARLGPPPGRGFRVFDSDKPEVWSSALARERLPYDVIILYPPHPTFLPAGQLTDLLQMLAPTGIAVVFLGTESVRKEAGCVLRVLRKTLPHVVPLVVHPIREVTGEPAFVAMASPKPLVLSSLRFRVKSRAITEGVFQAAIHFPLQPKWLAVTQKDCRAAAEAKE